MLSIRPGTVGKMMVMAVMVMELIKIKMTMRKMVVVRMMVRMVRMVTLARERRSCDEIMSGL